MSELLKAAVPEGGFKGVEDLKGSPISDEAVLENIRQSADINAPVFKKQAKREGSFIFVAGGATLAGFLDEIKDRSNKGEYICTSNMTHDYLVSNGIIPNACMIIDPKERVKDYIKSPQKTTKYYIGTVCNPQVAQGLLDADCDVEKLMVAYGMENEVDIELQKKIYINESTYSFLVGGTMAGLRAMPMSLLLGFSKIEYYGFDSCFSNDYTLVMSDDPLYDSAKRKPGRKVFIDADTKKEYVIDFPDDGGFYYAYKKARGEDIQIAETPDGKRYLTSPVFAHQAKQFIKWADRMEGKLEIIVHGESLSSNLLKCHWDSQATAKSNAGNRRWSEDYSTLQVSLHKNNNYGKWGNTDLELVGRSILSLYYKLKRKIKILDYGCGDANLSVILKNLFHAVEITNYDPFMEEYSMEPEGKYDIVTCMDVMEHVEYPYVENTLKYISSKAKYMLLFSIALSDAIKTLDDGRNAHITQKSGPWWINELSKQCYVVEAIYNAENAFFICQAFDAKENVDIELKEREATIGHNE